MSRILFSLTILTSVFICGCSLFSFDSNLNPDNFSEFYKNVKLETYKNNELAKLDYVDLGTVEGLSCQIKEDDPVANESDARDDARKKAVNQDANGIIFSSCIALSNTPACTTSVSCYARIIYVKGK